VLPEDIVREVRAAGFDDEGGGEARVFGKEVVDDCPGFGEGGGAVCDYGGGTAGVECSVFSWGKERLRVALVEF